MILQMYPTPLCVEAFKAVMKGHIVSYEATMIKCRQRRLLEIDAQLPVLVRDDMEAPLSSKLNNITKTTI